MAEDGERMIRFMLLEPKCECGKPIVALKAMKLTEDGLLHVFGFCENKCEKIVCTCNVPELIERLKAQFAEGANNVM